MLNIKKIIIPLIFSLLSSSQAHAIDEIDVCVIDDNAPYSNFDIWSRAGGVLPNLLNLLSIPEHVYFKPIPVNNMEKMVAMLRERKVKVIFPPLFSVPPEDILVSDSFGTRTWKLVVRNNNSNLSLYNDKNINLNGKKLYVLRNNPVVHVIKSYWPDVSLKEGVSIDESLKMLKAGSIDGIVIDSVLAEMLTNNLFPDQLISFDLPKIYVNLTLWLAPDQKDLLLAINKRISELSEKEISSNITRSLFNSILLYRSNSNISENTFINAWVIVCSLILLFLAAFLPSEIFRRRRAECNLLDSFTYWQTLLDSVPTPLFVCSLTGKITHCNQKLLSVLSLNIDQVVGSTFKQLTEHVVIEPPVKHLDWIDTIDTLGSKFSDRRIRILSTDAVFDINLWMAVFKDSKSIPQGILFGWFDISERKRLENELFVTTKQAICASKEKSDFLARMSHEIRSPMNAVIGILELELQKQSNPDSVLNIAYSASHQLLNVIGDVLDLSKIEAGEMQLQYRNCDITAFLQQLIKTYSVLAAKKGLILESNIQSVYKQHYYLDDAKLAQILSNLLSNAIKYTDQGSVKIEVLRESNDCLYDELTFRIKDTGSGIAPYMQEKILNPYVQVDPHSPASTGLGLTICTRLLKLMNSSLQISSVPDKGSCFSFLIHQEIINEKMNIAVERNPENETSFHLLVVDDQSANLVVMRLQLEKLGHHVMTCSDAKQAENMLMQQRFDIVFTDCQMPIMTGYEFTRRQRLSEQHTGNYQVIIGCTANAFSNERAKCFEAGMDDVLIKPITLDDLEKALSKQRNLVLNMKEIFALTTNQPKLINSIIYELQRSSEEELEQLLNLADNNIESYKSIIHRQKGSFALAGFVSGVEYCESIEQEIEINESSQIPLQRLRLNRLILRFIYLLKQQRTSES